MQVQWRRPKISASKKDADPYSANSRLKAQLSAVLRDELMSEPSTVSFGSSVFFEQKTRWMRQMCG
jgi:hypothetical protein